MFFLLNAFLHHQDAGTGPVVTALIGLGGAVIGGVLTIWGNYLRQHREQRQLARRVALGIAGEIEALLDISERRQYGKWLRLAAESPTPVRVSISATRDYFKVFDANVDKLGLLSPDLAEKVAMFYVRVAGILEDFQTMSNPPPWTEEERRRFYRDTADLGDRAAELGRQAVAGLRIFAK